jgi:hypothetical protein
MVTEENYSYFVKRFRPSNVESLAAKWAIPKSEFVPIVLKKPVAKISTFFVNLPEH